VTNILSLKQIDKRFGIVHALKNVSLDVEAGKTLALVGENGAGKSTLMKIITGVHQKDDGKILFEGAACKFRSPNDAMAIGISQAYQRAEVVPELTVAENIFMGENGFSKRGLVSPKRLYARAQTLLDQYEIPINARAQMKQLSVAACQLVAIVKILQRAPKLIIFDEPTAVLSDKEVELLFRLIAKLQREKRTIIYISHRMEEIFKVADSIAVMRDGEMVAVLKNENITQEDLVTHMLGRKLGAMFPKKHFQAEETKALVVEHVSNENVHDISFHLNRGEILGIAGLVGSGRTELVKAIYGIDRIHTGSVTLDGKKISKCTPGKMVREGVFLSPEDRKGEGVVLTRSIRENITYSRLRQFFRLGILQGKKERLHTEELKRKINIKAPTTSTLSGELSGGNQQKVVIAKALTAKPKVLIADEPTQGIDVGAKAEIYNLINELAKNGMSVLVISSEMEEIMGLCHRLLVMRNGKLVGAVPREHITDEKRILELMYRSEE